LFTFKLTVLIEAAQNTIFKILTSSGVFKPIYHISVYDFSVGIPTFMLCCEMLVFSLSFWWSNSFGLYRKLAADGHSKLGFWQGMGDCINTMDIIHGIGYLFKALMPDNFGKKYVQEPRPSDATIVESHATPVHSRGESEPDSIQKTSVPVYPNEKV
jgi:Organic solute transporter Ostalpha